MSLSARLPLRRIFSAILLACAISGVTAYDPPAGAYHLPSLFTPWGLASTPTVTGGESPWAARLNPSVSGGNQTAMLEAAYTGITDFGRGTQGWGSGASLAFSLPQDYAVLGGSFRFFSQAPGMTEMPLGNFGELRGNISKDLYRNLYVGAGLGVTMGGNGGFGWGLGLDLGITHLPGDLGPFKDFRWGVALTDIGKSYSTPLPATGGLGTASPSAYPSAFTLGTGARGYLVRDYYWSWDVGADLRLPAFQDLDLGISTGLTYRDIVTARLGWSAGLRDAIAGSNRSYGLSFGLSGNIPLSSGVTLAKNKYRDAEVKVASAVAPMYGTLSAVGLGASLDFGLKDRSAPMIDAKLPVPIRGTYFMSPNGDGKKDKLEIPLKITDERNIAGWNFRIEDQSAGKVIRSIGESHVKPERFAGFEGLLDAAKFVKKGVEIPEVLVWDGKDDAGAYVKKGTYIVSIEAWDDNENHNVDYMSCMVVSVDTEQPDAAISSPSGSMILSPDGDGNRDNLEFRLRGDVQKSWKVEVADAFGKIVYTQEFRDQAPPDFPWDGTASDGRRVPDGKYSITLSTVRESGNEASRTLRGVIVDTRRPEVAITLDAYAMSPNGDGIKDTVRLDTKIGSVEGMESWRIFVMDSGRKEIWSASGSTLTPPPASYDFGGFVGGKLIADGSYEAGIEVAYVNGYRPLVISEPFTVDSTAPTARIAIGDQLAVFSPDGDGKRDDFSFRIEGSEEDLWMLELRNSRNETIRIVEFQGSLPAEFKWDGRDGSAKIAPDGDYSAFIWSMDKAGNSGNARSASVKLDSRRPGLRLAVDRGAFSPNGDGAQDTLSLAVAMESRDAVRSWKLAVEPAQGGAALWEQSGADASTLKAAWTIDGRDSRGARFPEGAYIAKLSVEYLNGWTSDARTGNFTVDTTMPYGTVAADREAFNPTGKEDQSRVRFTQGGAQEKTWSGEMLGASGAVVRRWEFGELPPPELVWDGTNETGTVLADGKYTYVLKSADVAGNSFRTPGIDVVLETVKKAVRLDVDARAFSPNGDGGRDSITIMPTVQAADRVRSYELSILAQEGREAMTALRQWKGAGSVPSKFLWDGRTDQNAQAPDGRYAASLTVVYANADVVQAGTQAFLLDTVSPSIEVAASGSLFSPNGDGRSDTIRITQKSGIGDDWAGRILSADGRAVRNYSWRGQAASFEWNGRDDAGNVVPDGIYYYDVSSIDLAGNRSPSMPRITLEVENARKTVAVSTDIAGFSPNGDNSQDQVAYIVKLSSPERVASFELAIRQAGQAAAATGATASAPIAPIRSWTNATELKDRYIWDGKTDNGLQAPDGKYEAELAVRYTNDDFFRIRSPVVVLDTIPPKATVRIDSPLFSPNGDGVKDLLRIAQESAPGDDWNGRLISAAGSVVRTWSWKSSVTNVDWNGKDDSGAQVRDGTYSYELSARDGAGNRTTVTVGGIRLDATKPKVYVTADKVNVSPNGDGILDDVSFTLVTEGRDGVETWRFSLLDRAGVERSFFGGSGSDVPARLVWDGRDLQGQVVQGEYTGRLEVRYLKGDVASATSQKLLVKVDPPKVELTVTPEYFSPDGDGEDDVLTFGIAIENPAGFKSWKLEILETAVIESAAPGAVGAERLFMEWSGNRAPPASIKWNGKSTRGELVESATDYPFRFTATDPLGNRTTISGFIAVDVLVLKDGDRLKIRVPSIVFRANYADFVGLDRETVARNERVVSRIAQILNKFPDYRIRIEGHANNIGKMLGYPDARISAEETKELIPLSMGRAELVRGMLERYGVDSRRLSVDGLGSSEPVVSFTDVENRWKNRRVEFVLIKNQQ